MRYLIFSSLFAALIGAGAGASAQTIERVRLTDNDLNCTQIYAEVQQMDSMIKLAGSMPPPAPAMAAAPAYPAYPAAQPAPQMQMPQQSQAYALQSAAMADPRVAASIARARAAGMSDAMIAAQLGVGMQRAGLPPMPAGQAYAPANAPANAFAGLAAAQGGGAAGFAGLFGAIAGAATQANTPAPAPVAAAPVMPVAQAPSAQAGNLALQAQGRKEHLTSMFLSRGCKLADVQK